MISRLFQVASSIWKLGPVAIGRVAAYRIACRSGLYRMLLPVQSWEGIGDFFAPSPLPPPSLSIESRRIHLDRANALLTGQFQYFSSTHYNLGIPPDWFLDPFSGTRLEAFDHWSRVNEFSTVDIKNVWEVSRFEWVPQLAQAWRLTGDERYLQKLNVWLLDWVKRNPFNQGPNWKCGQEASIRLINLLLAARILDTHKQPSSLLVDLIVLHCSRIIPTIGYAAAQNNNHGTSEAAALFIGGAWLYSVADVVSLRRKADRWRKAGRRWLEERVAKLVAEDGSFSQYSVNYHRVLVDTLCQVEVWRRDLQEHPFSPAFVERCRAAVSWLAVMTDSETGGAPNVGANDGALLYALSSTPYRDFRPSVQVSSILFRGSAEYEQGDWNEPLSWLSLPVADRPASLHSISVLHRSGGDVVLCGEASKGVIRFANFRFRPSHADCFHFDLWHKGLNILRDGGTYSYNTESRWLDYFSGTESHNTIQFDGRSQMPRIGRFLFGSWLSMDEYSGIQASDGGRAWTGVYTDWRHVRHRRTVCVTGDLWRVVDEIDGFKEKAVLRWRLMSAPWELEGNVCRSGVATISITTDAPLRRMELGRGWESLHYQQMSELSVLEVEVPPGRWTIESVIELKD